MLLPAAFSYDMYTACQPRRPQRPILPSFVPYENTSQSPRSGPAGLFASCRALQSMLGGPVQTARSPSPAPPASKPAHQSNPFTSRRRLQSPPRIVAPPRGANKRSRDKFEDDRSPSTDGAQTRTEERSAYQTPKRQRRAPRDLPLGLDVSDFEALNTPILIRKQHPHQEDHGQQLDRAETSPLSIRNPSPRYQRTRRRSRHTTDRLQWSPDEDRLLIEAVLSKLNLSKRDWNDCAKQLGKDQDSLGRRWQMLVGEGNVGLRRGVGRMERTGLDVQSW